MLVIFQLMKVEIFYSVLTSALSYQGFTRKVKSAYEPRGPSSRRLPLVSVE